MGKYKYARVMIKGAKKRVHRIIMESHIGRPLKDNEHVYHLNGDGLDNRIENLVIITKKPKE